MDRSCGKPAPTTAPPSLRVEWVKPPSTGRIEFSNPTHVYRNPFQNFLEVFACVLRCQCGKISRRPALIRHSWVERGRTKNNEQSAGLSWNAQGCVHSYLRRQAEEVGCQRSSLRRLGDVPHQRLSREPRSHLRIANQRLVRTGPAALRRRRQNLASARSPRRSTT